MGLANVVGRPEPLAPSTQLSPADAAVVWCMLEGNGPVPGSIRELTPHRWIVDFVGSAHADEFHQPTGTGLTWFVASGYNSNHVKNRRSPFLGLSGVSMSIWLTRHWTLDELLAQAAAELRAYPPDERRREILRARCGAVSP